MSRRRCMRCREFFDAGDAEQWICGPCGSYPRELVPTLRGIVALQIAEEQERQRGWVMKPRDEINNIEMEPFKLWEPGSPKQDCSICRLVHGDEIQHVCE